MYLKNLKNSAQRVTNLQACILSSNIFLSLLPHISLTVTLVLPYVSLTVTLVLPYVSLTVTLVLPYVSLTVTLVLPHVSLAVTLSTVRLTCSDTCSTARLAYSDTCSTVRLTYSDTCSTARMTYSDTCSTACMTYSDTCSTARLAHSDTCLQHTVCSPCDAVTTQSNHTSRSLTNSSNYLTNSSNYTQLQTKPSYIITYDFEQHKLGVETNPSIQQRNEQSTVALQYNNQQKKHFLCHYDSLQRGMQRCNNLIYCCCSKFSSSPSFLLLWKQL
jgi:hypothetical protein